MLYVSDYLHEKKDKKKEEMSVEKCYGKKLVKVNGVGENGKTWTFHAIPSGLARYVEV